MRKLLLTVIAGTVCGVFGSAYADTAQRDRMHIAQASPTGTAPSSEKGMKTPRQIEDSRMDPANKGAAKGMAQGGAAAGSSATGAASTTGAGASSSATTDIDAGAKKSRRAARREKG